MSRFEFIFVLISIVAGLALTQLLSGLTRSLRQSGRNVDIAHALRICPRRQFVVDLPVDGYFPSCTSSAWPVSAQSQIRPGFRRLGFICKHCISIRCSIGRLMIGRFR